MKIDLPLALINEFAEWSPRWKTVEAEIVDVAPHLPNATFAAHMSVTGSFYLYTVSNIETGTFVGQGETKDEAIKDARIILSTKTVVGTDKALAKTYKILKEKGLA